MVPETKCVQDCLYPFQMNCFFLSNTDPCEIPLSLKCCTCAVFCDIIKNMKYEAQFPDGLGNEQYILKVYLHKTSYFM